MKRQMIPLMILVAALAGCGEKAETRSVSAVPKKETASVPAAVPKPEKSVASTLFPFCVKDNRCGYFDITAKQFAIQAQFENAGEFAANSLANIKQNGKWGYIDAKGQMVIQPQFENAGDFAANGLAFIRQNGKWGYIDAKGQMVIQPQFEDADAFAANGLARIRQNGKDGYIDAKGQMVIQPQFEDAGAFAANGLAIIRQNGKWGYIDAKGQMVIQPQFEYANNFAANGLARIIQNSEWDFIDAKGQKVVYADAVCDTPVIKNADEQVVWPKKPVADICAEAEYARKRENESRLRESIDSANREASYRAYQQCKIEMDTCFNRGGGTGCYRDCERLR